MRSDLDEIRLELEQLEVRAVVEHAQSERVLEAARAELTERELDRVESPARHAVSVQMRSANSKLSPQRDVEARSGRARFEPVGPYVASTYVSIAATCPSSCGYKDNGCFAQTGASHLTMAKLDAAGRRTIGLEVTRAEARAIDRLWKRGVPQDGAGGRGRDLRLHVGGDVSCEEGARLLAAAAKRYRARGGGTVWTYTARWREIPREAWGPIAVLGSVQRLREAAEAVRHGYAPAVSVDLFRTWKAYEVAPGVVGIPCPYEANDDGPTCVQCRLCLDRDLVKMKRAIIFEAHGPEAMVEAVRHRLRVINR